jgi:hypothetical protein
MHCHWNPGGSNEAGKKKNERKRKTECLLYLDCLISFLPLLQEKEKKME